MWEGVLGLIGTQGLEALTLLHSEWPKLWSFGHSECSRVNDASPVSHRHSFLVSAGHIYITGNFTIIWDVIMKRVDHFCVSVSRCCPISSLSTC